MEICSITARLLTRHKGNPTSNCIFGLQRLLFLTQVQFFLSVASMGYDDEEQMKITSTEMSTLKQRISS